jgi:transposase
MSQLHTQLERNLHAKNDRLQAENARLRKIISQLRQVIASLKSENRQQKEAIAKLNAQVAKLEKKAARLQVALDAAQRENKRQAAPFSKGPPKANAKRPGRKSGAAYGKKAHRPPPPPDQIDECYEAPLPDTCPHCGGSDIEEKEVAVQYQAEMPCRPIYRQFNIHVGRCAGCGHRLQGRHRLQTSDAIGAAASQLGPQAQASIVFLNKRCGMSHGKISLVMEEFFGLPITPGGVAQVILRAGRRLKPAYQQIAASVHNSPWAVGDETGWKVGGRRHWLHVVVGDNATWFKIARRRVVAPALQTLGADYRGVLIHDGYSSYGRFRKAEHQQCVNHALNRARKMLRTAVGSAARFPREVIALLTAGLKVRELYKAGQLDENDLADAYLTLSIRLEELTSRPRRNSANARFAKHLRRHASQWFWYLLVPGVDATNWRAEQALRAGVVNRKVWGGNRTDPGRAAQEVTCSVIETCRRQRQSSIQFIADALCSQTPHLLPNLCSRPPPLAK